VAFFHLFIFFIFFADVAQHKKHSFQCFLAAIFVFGLSHSVASGFLFLFLRDLGATESLMGVATIAQTLAEIPVMFWSGHMLSRYGSRAVIVASMVLYGLRMLGTTFLSPDNTTALVLPLQLLGGLAFGYEMTHATRHDTTRVCGT
jgi:PPP family 3-phenylpropionic acid transporter